IRIDVSGEPAYLDKELFREKFSVSTASTSKITELFTSLFSAEAAPTIPDIITVDRITPILEDYQEKKAALLSHPFSLYDSPRGFLSDKEVVLAAVKKNGSELYFASDLLSPVPEAILTYSALHYRDPSMKEAIQTFIGQVLEGTFVRFRNAHNSHARFLTDDQKRIWETFSSHKDWITKEKGTIEVLISHGNTAPYEYEDGGVGVSDSGKYEIRAHEV
ncbi:MAG: DUF4116 domain-containing protein, partial [Simkaniaceae bacterium]|nr:DUF4116 domain-containing protein [Simkaniaceae bacterium]